MNAEDYVLIQVKDQNDDKLVYIQKDKPEKHWFKEGARTIEGYKNFAKDKVYPAKKHNEGSEFKYPPQHQVEDLSESKYKVEKLMDEENKIRSNIENKLKIIVNKKEYIMNKKSFGWISN